MPLSVIAFCSTFFPAAKVFLFFAQKLGMKRITERIASLAFIVMSYNLMQRRRMAWFITTFLLPASLIQQRNMQRAKTIVLKYGQNPGAYFTLEDDKCLYFSRCAEGIAACGVVGSTVLVNGDPICAPEDFRAVPGEFKDVCVRSSRKLIFLSITDVHLSVFCPFACGEGYMADITRRTDDAPSGITEKIN